MEPMIEVTLLYRIDDGNAWLVQDLDGDEFVWKQHHSYNLVQSASEDEIGPGDKIEVPVNDLEAL